MEAIIITLTIINFIISIWLINKISKTVKKIREELKISKTEKK